MTKDLLIFLLSNSSNLDSPGRLASYNSSLSIEQIKNGIEGLKAMFQVGTKELIQTLRQFKLEGEPTPEFANRIGYKLYPHLFELSEPLSPPSNVCFDEDGLKGTIDLATKHDPRDVLRLMGVNPDEYKILKCWFKTHQSGKITHSIDAKPLYYLDQPKNLISEYENFKNYIKENPIDFQDFTYHSHDNFVALICLFDAHFGKTTNPYTNEVITLETQRSQFKRYLKTLIGKTLTQGTPEKFIFPIGNDYFNCEHNLQTTKGTPQDNTIDIRGMLKVGLSVLVDCITYLNEIAPVEVIYVPSNHDRGFGQALSVAIAQIYEGSTSVKVDDGSNPRKYRKYGVNSFMFEHGELKADDYPALFATESPEIWASTQNRVAVLGHTHHEHSKELRGLLLKYLAALTSSDRWHFEKGYVSKQKGYALLFGKEEGSIGEFYSTK